MEFNAGELFKVITPSAIITIIVLLIVIGHSKSAKTLFFNTLTMLVAMNLNVFTATAFYIGSQEINCDDLVLVFCSLSSLYLLFKGVELPKKQVALVFILFAIVMLGFSMTLVSDGTIHIILPNQSWDSFYYGYETPGVLSLTPRCFLITVRLMLFCLILLIAQSVLDKKAIIKMARIVLVFSVFHVIYSLIEFIDKALLTTNFTVVFSQLFFSPIFTTSTSRGGIVTLWGFTREPSHFATAMFFVALICVLLLSMRRLKPWETLTGLLATFLMLVSGGFSSMMFSVGLVVFFALALIRRFRIKKDFKKIDVRLVIVLIGLLVFVGLGVLVLLGNNSYYALRLTNIVENIPALISRDYGSLQGTPDSMPRMISIVEAFYLFTAYPIFGVGLGTVNPFSAVFGILVNAGLFGLVVWMILLSSYTRTFSGYSSGRFFVLLFLSIGLFNMDTGLMYSPIWLLVCGMFWSSKILQKDKLKKVPNSVF